MLKCCVYSNLWISVTDKQNFEAKMSRAQQLLSSDSVEGESFSHLPSWAAVSIENNEGLISLHTFRAIDNCKCRRYTAILGVRINRNSYSSRRIKKGSCYLRY